jgi:hypothetical protein
MLLHSEIFDVSQLLDLLPTLKQLETTHGVDTTEKALQELGNRQTNARTETWSYDENGQWYDEQQLDEAKPFDSSTFARKRGGKASTSSGDLRSQLVQFATRVRPLLSSPLSATKEIFLCRHAILTPS